jgi:glycosyltransferase involved in cell wall biosynthesis
MLDPWFQRDPSRRFKALRNSIYWSFFERHVVNGSDALLFTCEEELRLARSTFRGYRPKQEVNIGYGIAEPPVFNSRMHTAFHSKCPELRSKPYFLFLGRIHPKKGVDLLIQAYEAVLKTKSLKTTVFPDLVIAGPGWDSNYGRELKASLPQIARVHVLDMLEGDAKWGALHGCQAFILPSHQENFGIAVVEALACNKPVLISDKVNIWREIERDGAGFVAPDSLEGTIKLLMAQKNQPPEPHTTRFRDCFSKHFCIHSATQKMSAFFEESSLCR